MKKLLAGTLLGFGMLVATATSASAAEWYYTGYWYHTAAACEEGYQDMVGGPGGPGVDLPHECRSVNGVYELWRMR
ncbi:hypothetical protein AB0I53_02820 [Saccharopolyspora sp. NPDC050389]|uniref:hypothetical protein n=1 Tax=Saccharopolyspora sp. NPDC050389 TaxID=3155516 RepID=UPI0033E873B3